MTKLINDTDINKKTLLGYELSPREDAIVNYLVPSVCACILYIFLIASDISVIYSHYKNNDPIWASLTIFIMHLPVLGSYIIVVSDWNLWPELEGCGTENIKWITVKTLEHLLFPVWSMWRFAERIFWSIEAIRCNSDELIEQAKSVVNAGRSIELYVFLQSYLHSLPQILLQLYILIRHNSDISKQTEVAQFLSLIFNLSKVSITTTYYQRFKSQKLTGKQYPWFKSYKASRPSSVVVRSEVPRSRSVVQKQRNTVSIEEVYDVAPPRLSERRRSSDIYLEPSTSDDSRPQTMLERNIQIRNSNLVTESTESDYISHEKAAMLRETSVIDGPQRRVFREQTYTTTSERTEPDFSISRVIYVKGLKDDDLAGKLVAYSWWFCFLLVRVLAISIFAYFFTLATFILLFSHVALVVAILIYDVKSDEVRRSKGIFFLFIGLIYIFCIIEFKIKFKKAMFIYYGFFVLVFTENFIMSLVWVLEKMESIENDFWFRYALYVIIMGSLLSFSSMMFYFIVNKPPKVLIKSDMVQ